MLIYGEPQGSYKVVVLMSLYKSGRFIESKIESLLKQSYQDVLYVFLNCQNIDNELDYCSEFATGRTNVINIVFREHCFLYKSWNAGISITKSEYITTYNADDQWHPDFLSKCVEYLDNVKECGVLSTGVLVSDIENQVWPNWTSISRIPLLTYPKTTAGPSPMWRRKLHSVYGEFGNYRTIGDARFWESLHDGGEQFHIIEEDLVLYYLNGESLERRVDQSGRSYRELDLTDGTV